MNFNGFTWLLLAFPIYLLSKGRFVDYLLLPAGKTSESQSDGYTGSW